MPAVDVCEWLDMPGTRKHDLACADTLCRGEAANRTLSDL